MQVPFSREAKLTAAQLEVIEAYVRQARVEELQLRIADFDASFNVAARTVVDKLRSEGVSKDVIRAALVALAQRYGEGGGAATLGASFLVTAIALVEFWSAWHRSRNALPQVVGLEPYLRYRTVDKPESQGGTTRDRHYMLNGFVARSAWGGWAIAGPPNGWNCRCFLERIDWRASASAGWSGDFPNGDGLYVEWLAAGGPDDGFPWRDFSPI